jgi:hypothetical protein
VTVTKTGSTMIRAAATRQAAALVKGMIVVEARPSGAPPEWARICLKQAAVVALTLPTKAVKVVVVPEEAVAA